MRSDILTPTDLDFLVEKFDVGWDDAVPKPRRAPGATGSSIHVHLLDRPLEHASANLLIADAVLDVETIAVLIAVDPDIWVEVHVQQDLPDVGAIPSVHLSPEVLGVLATSERFAEGLDIDQHGASGHPILGKVLEPIHTRRWGYRYAHRLLVESADGASLAVELDPESEDDAAIVEQLRLWRAVHPGPVSSCVSEQVIRVPGNQGIGMHIERGVLNVIHDFGVGLELRARTSFSLTAAPHRRPSKS